MTAHLNPVPAKPGIALAASLLAVSGALWWRPVLHTMALALSDEAYTHILLILPLSCALLYLERKRFGPVPSFRVDSSVVWLVAALLIAGFARWGPTGLPEDVRLSLNMLALVTWWIGSFLFCFGKQTFRAFLFPICFLFWIVPLPTSVLDAVIEFLQHQSAFAARIMFMGIGVPVTQDGVILSLPNLDIEVARECSSIRSSMVLVVTTMLFSHLFLRSWWRKVLLIALAIPLAAIKNGFRIFTITELATRVDPSFFDGKLHHRGGIVFLAMALTMMIALLWVLRRTEGMAPERSEATSTN